MISCKAASPTPTVAASRLKLTVPWLKPGRSGARKALSSEACVSRLGSSAGVSQPAAEAYAFSVLVVGAQSPSDKD